MYIHALQHVKLMITMTLVWYNYTQVHVYK